jgi:hypothetical protein
MSAASVSTPTPDAPTLVDAVVDTMTAGYVFPDRSARAAELLRTRLDDGAYDLPLGPELCDLLSADLLAACEDRHLRLIWHDDAIASADEASLVADLHELFRLENHGVQRVERRPGNAGLVGLTIVPDAASAGPAMAAALRLVEHTHALVLDLRETRGGAPTASRSSRASSSPTATSTSRTSSRARTARSASCGRRAGCRGRATPVRCGS